MQPQTLQIATWLLYFDGFFALVSLIDKSGYIGYLRYQFPFGGLLGLISVGDTLPHNLLFHLFFEEVGMGQNLKDRIPNQLIGELYFKVAAISAFLDFVGFFIDVVPLQSRAIIH